jgi:hypothetical protein
MEFKHYAEVPHGIRDELVSRVRNVAGRLGLDR